MSRRRGRFCRTGRRNAVATRVAVALWLIGCVAAAAKGAPAGEGGWLQAAAVVRQTPVAAEAPAKADPAPAEPAKWQKPVPLTFHIDYTLVSDYVWRGINLSEYAGEGREKLNHPTTVCVSYDTGKCGTITAAFWFEWYAAQQKLTPWSGGDLQEIDYTISWSYTIESCNLDVEVGWIFYQFPRLTGQGQRTSEWYVGLSYDDSKLFGTKEGVLNPTVTYYMDVDQFHGGQWLEFGVSHEFELADCCPKTPVLKDLTLTPSLTLGTSHRYLTRATQLANLVYGFAASYDLSGALGIPEKCGSLSVTGFLNFSQALGVKDDVAGYQDELYGGMTVAYEW